MCADIEIRQMEHEDIARLAETFSVWGKGNEKFAAYFDQQQEGKRTVLVAVHKAIAVGYVTVVWESACHWFRQQHIPELVDLNVITKMQRGGVGTRLIVAAETLVQDRGYTRTGISVEQSHEYEVANWMYRKLGYLPDGRGITSVDNEMHLIKRFTETARLGPIIEEESNL